MKFQLPAFLAALSAMSLSAIAGPGIIAQWNYDAVQHDPATGNYTDNVPSWAHDPTVTVSDLTVHGSVIHSTVYNLPFVYVGFTPTLSYENYIGFTVNPKPGERLHLTSLDFFYFTGNSNVDLTGYPYTWSYRIDEGSGFGNWVSAGTQLPKDAPASWTFPAPIDTTGTVEFAFSATAPTPAANVVPTANKFLALHGTCGNTAVDPSLQGILHQYSRVTTYFGGLPKEASAVTYDWDSDTLLTVDDEGAGIQEISKTGAALGGMGMTQLKFPDGLKGDPEALAYLGKDSQGHELLMIGAERENVSMIMQYNRGSFNDPDWIRTTPAITWGPTNGNLGLEGLSFDSRDGSYWGVNERDPMAIKHATAVGTPSQALALIDMNDLIWRLGINTLSDIYVLANSNAYANNDHLLVLARDNRKIIEITKTGQVVEVMDTTTIGRSTIEGITMDNAGIIYLVSEGSSQVQSVGALHVIAPAKHSVPGTGGRQALWGTAGDDEIVGNQAADTLTGGEGADTFVFSSLRDGIDTITDFTPGVDILDVGALLKSIGFVGNSFSYNPLTGGTMRVIDDPSGALVQVKSGTSYRTLIVLQGLTAAQAGVATNFRFVTTKVTAGTPQN